MPLLLLSDTQREIQALARSYAERELAPLAQARDRESRFDRAMVAQMAELGFFGMLSPEQHDGLALDAQSYLLALEEIAVVDASAAVLLSVHNSLPTQMILNFGSDAQRTRFLGPMARGECLGAFALSEPEAGSDAAALRCQAVRDGGDWLLSGTKSWVSHGNEAGVGATLTVHHIGTFAFTANKTDIQLVRAVLQDLDDDNLTAPTCRLDWHNAAMHDVVSPRLPAAKGLVCRLDRAGMI